ncbi:MAG: hypothetical protein WC413_01760 [Candidatus Nanoarchaeia archaeon]
MKAIYKEEMPLLKRTKFEFEIEHINAKTPSNQELINKISELEKAPAELVSVKHIYTNYGLAKSRIVAFIYKDQKTYDLFEKKKEKKVEGAPAA